MIISKKVWKEHDELIKSLIKEMHSLYHRIEELNCENSRLRYLLNKTNLFTIDFPNSQKEVSNNEA